MFSIRQKILLVFGGLLLVLAGIAIMTILQIQRIGSAIDIILRENYQSVVACQEMKESLERIDSGVVFTLFGAVAEGQTQIDESTRRFSKALEIEMSNITVEGEGEKADSLSERYRVYLDALPLVTDPSRPLEARRADYFGTLLPLFNTIKGLAQEIQEMNRSSMSDANDAARAEAASAQVVQILDSVP